jgi:hypothetical protein
VHAIDEAIAAGRLRDADRLASMLEPSCASEAHAFHGAVAKELGRDLGLVHPDGLALVQAGLAMSNGAGAPQRAALVYLERGLDELERETGRRVHVARNVAPPCYGSDTRNGVSLAWLPDSRHLLVQCNATAVVDTRLEREVARFDEPVAIDPVSLPRVREGGPPPGLPLDPRATLETGIESAGGKPSMALRVDDPSARATTTTIALGPEPEHFETSTITRTRDGKKILVELASSTPFAMKSFVVDLVSRKILHRGTGGRIEEAADGTLAIIDDREDGSAYGWNPSTNAVVWRAAKVGFARVSPDGRRIAYLARDPKRSDAMYRFFAPYVRDVTGPPNAFDVDSIWTASAGPPPDWPRAGPLEAKTQHGTMGGWAAAISVQLGSDTFGPGDGIEFGTVASANGDPPSPSGSRYWILDPFRVPSSALAHPEDLRCRVGIHVLRFAACRAWFSGSSTRP